MYTEHERQNYINLVVDILKADSNVLAMFLVGSLGNGTHDKYSDVDITVVVKDNCVKKVYKNFEKHITKNFDCFKYFKTEYNPNSLLYGIFTNSALEIDLGFNNLENFNLTRSKKGSSNILELYSVPSFKLEKLKANKNKEQNLVEARNSDMWYYFKNCIFALKRNKLFRAINELEEIRNNIIEIYAEQQNLIFKHYRNLDNFNEDTKAKIKKLYPKKISIGGLKQTLIYSLNLFCEQLELCGLKTEATQYKTLFTNLIKEVKL